MCSLCFGYPSPPFFSAVFFLNGCFIVLLVYSPGGARRFVIMAGGRGISREMPTASERVVTGVGLRTRERVKTACMRILPIIKSPEVDR